jgi:transposase InsO family protein
VNHKRLFRIYREERLTVRKRGGRKRALGTRAPIPLPLRPNKRWSLDFVHDQFACGRRFRIPNIVDDVTWECLAAIPDTSISGRRVARELTMLIEQRGKPGMIVSDTEFTSNAMLAWTQENSITWLSLSETQSGWRLTENRTMLLRDEGSLQAHWLDGRRPDPVAGSARGRDLDIATADKRSAANSP